MKHRCDKCEEEPAVEVAPSHWLCIKHTRRAWGVGSVKGAAVRMAQFVARRESFDSDEPLEGFALTVAVNGRPELLHVRDASLDRDELQRRAEETQEKVRRARERSEGRPGFLTTWYRTVARQWEQIHAESSQRLVAALEEDDWRADETARHATFADLRRYCDMAEKLSYPIPSMFRPLFEDFADFYGYDGSVDVNTAPMEQLSAVVIDFERMLADLMATDLWVRAGHPHRDERIGRFLQDCEYEAYRKIAVEYFALG